MTHYRHKPELEGSDLHQQQTLSSPKCGRVQISCLGLLPSFWEMKMQQETQARMCIFSFTIWLILVEHLQNDSYCIPRVSLEEDSIQFYTNFYHIQECTDTTLNIHSIILYIPFLHGSVIANLKCLGLCSVSDASCRTALTGRVRNSFALQTNTDPLRRLPAAWSAGADQLRARHTEIVPPRCGHPWVSTLGMECPSL